MSCEVENARTLARILFDAVCDGVDIGNLKSNLRDPHRIPNILSAIIPDNLNEDPIVPEVGDAPAAVLGSSVVDKLQPEPSVVPLHGAVDVGNEYRK